jgi:hypothetical protein
MKYEELFTDNTMSKIDVDKLEAYVRHWHALEASEKDKPLEQLVKHGTSGYYDKAVDYVINLLSFAGDEVDADEPTLTQCCEELASWGVRYENCFGCRIIHWENGNCSVRWGSGDDYSWADLGALLKAMPHEGEMPDWWSEEWTDYEHNDWRGQHFVKQEDLPTDDPRHPDYEEEEEA